MKIQKEAVLLIAMNDEPQALVRRDEKTRKIIFYKIEEMNLEDVERLFNEKKHEEIIQD